jgi:hypothetical protein
MDGQAGLHACPAGRRADTRDSPWEAEHRARSQPRLSAINDAVVSMTTWIVIGFGAFVIGVLLPAMLAHSVREKYPNESAVPAVLAYYTILPGAALVRLVLPMPFIPFIIGDFVVGGVVYLVTAHFANRKSDKSTP